MQKIHFNNRHGLTRAVVEEYKTKTRRIATFDELKDPNTGWLTEKPEAGKLVLCDGGRIVAKSQYRMNEILAVAQSYKDVLKTGYDLVERRNIRRKLEDALGVVTLEQAKGWSNKLFVRADLMPHQIQITDIKAERLQDISDEDCLKEGVCKFDYGFYVPGLYRIPSRRVEYPFKTPRESFAALIERPGIGHKGDWSKNPWVFAYTFKLVKPEIKSKHSPLQTPLTPELLMKNGFQRFDTPNDDTITAVFIYQHFQVSQRHDGALFWVVIDTDAVICQLEYLHQLQNSLRAIGIEKEITI